MFFKSFFGGAIALIAVAALNSPALAQSQPSSQSPSEQQNVNTAQVNEPRAPGRRGQPEIFEDTDLDPIEGDLGDDTDDNSVEVFLRLNTELFVNGGDLVEFEVPIRYAPGNRVSMQASPIIKYFPESAEENFDYGFKFAVEYRL